MLRIILKESREQQLRRELDDVVNGTDYGASIEQADNDPTVARAKGLEIDEPNNVESRPEYTHQMSAGRDYNKIDLYPNGRVQRILCNPNSSEDNTLVEFYENGKVKSITYTNKRGYEASNGPIYILYDEYGNVLRRAFVWGGKIYSSIRKWIMARHYDTDGDPWADPYILPPPLTEEELERELETIFQVEKNRRNQALKYRAWVEGSDGRLSTHDLDDEPHEEYKFTKSREQSSDPRFAGLDLADNQPPQKTDDKELGTRAQGLEIEPPKERDTYKFSKNRKPPADPRFKGLELDESTIKRIVKEELEKIGENNILSEAAMAERYVRQELHKIFPELKKKVENYYRSKTKKVETHDYKLEFKDKKVPHVIPMQIFLEPSDNISYSVGGGYNIKTSILEIIISLPKIDFITDVDLKKKLDKSWSDLYKAVRTALVHELIHKGQADMFMGFTTSDLKSRPNYDFFGGQEIEPKVLEKLYDFTSRYLDRRDPATTMGNLMTKLPDFFSPVEIEAYAREAYMLAKKERIDFDKAIVKASDADFRKSFRSFFPTEEKKLIHLFEFFKQAIKYYAKKHLFQKAPSPSRAPSAKRQQGNYRPPS